jgi:hypothetical protein
MGCVRVTKGGNAILDTDEGFAELAHDRFWTPGVDSSQLDALAHAFVDRKLEVRLDKTKKADVGELEPQLLRSRPPSNKLRASKPRHRRRQRRTRDVHQEDMATTNSTSRAQRPMGINGVIHRFDFCSMSSIYMRHRVWRKWRMREKIGTSGQAVGWMRHRARIKFTDKSV